MARPRKQNVSDEERAYLDYRLTVQHRHKMKQYAARLHKLVLDVFECEVKGMTASEIAEELNDKWIVRERK